MVICHCGFINLKLGLGLMFKLLYLKVEVLQKKIHHGSHRVDTCINHLKVEEHSTEANVSSNNKHHQTNGDTKYICIWIVYVLDG
jgi:hypothetical protein